MFNRTSWTGVLGTAAVVALTAGSASAGLLAANSGGAIPAYTGSVNFAGGLLSFTVDADVDYAVFAPGTFEAAFPGQDPSGGTEYVYAYQITNNDTDVSKLTVGLDGDEPLGSIGFVSDVSSTDPTASLFVGTTSAAWDFTVPNPLVNGAESSVLIFTSAAAPEWDSGTVEASFPDSQQLPSPLPEPASLGLVALGLGLVSVRRHRK